MGVGCWLTCHDDVKIDDGVARPRLCTRESASAA